MAFWRERDKEHAESFEEIYRYFPILAYRRRLVSRSILDRYAQYPANSDTCSITGCRTKEPFPVSGHNLYICFSPTPSPLLKIPLSSNLLAQTSKTATSSLEIQLDTSRKVLELTKDIAIMSAAAKEASRVSGQVSEILQLIGTLGGTTGAIESLTNDVRLLAVRSQGISVSALFIGMIDNDLLRLQKPKKRRSSHGSHPPDTLKNTKTFVREDYWAQASGFLTARCFKLG